MRQARSSPLLTGPLITSRFQSRSPRGFSGSTSAHPLRMSGSPRSLTSPLHLSSHHRRRLVRRSHRPRLNPLPPVNRPPSHLHHQPPQVPVLRHRSLHLPPYHHPPVRVLALVRARRSLPPAANHLQSARVAASRPQAPPPQVSARRRVSPLRRPQVRAFRPRLVRVLRRARVQVSAPVVVKVRQRLNRLQFLQALQSPHRVPGRPVSPHPHLNRLAQVRVRHYLHRLHSHLRAAPAPVSVRARVSAHLRPRRHR